MHPLLSNAPFITDIPVFELHDLPAALRSFSARPFSERQRYTQDNYGVAFDGYSWPGQVDSLNQGPEDGLHSFVFSDFLHPTRYPREFQPFLASHWPAVSAAVRELEQSVLTELELAQVASQHRRHFGHMMSANFYPALTGSSFSPGGLRLTEHPDVSLLTVFPFGIVSEFQYRDANGDWVDLPTCNRVVVFAGDLLQWITDGEVAALHHRVARRPGDSAERFSFALFSLPKPGETLCDKRGNNISAEDWYRLHLSQWDP